MEKKSRRVIERILPPFGTSLTAKHNGQLYEAKIIRSKKNSEKPAILFRDKEYKTMSAAAITITGYAVNGWRFWHSD